MQNHEILVYLLAGLGSCVLSLLVTPAVRKLAISRGFVDRPDGRRKTHKTAVALGGGAAVLLAMAGGLGLVFAFAAWQGLELITSGNVAWVSSLALGAIVIVALGLVDDLVGLRGRQKLLGQVVVVGLLIWAGVRIESFGFFGYPVMLGAFVIPATAFWLLGTTNAVNLIDGIDGLAGSVGFILSLTMAALAAWQNSPIGAAIMLALAGAQLGFLRYNFAPATIYLGDAGSMLIGLLCGTIAVVVSAKSTAAMAFAVPIAVWLIPILDSFAALIRRKLTGRSLFAADRGHLHHSLLIRGWSVRQASLFIALISATTCLSAMLSVYLRDERIALLTVVAVMIFLVFTRTFGHIEFALVKDRVRFLANSLVRVEAADATSLRDSCIQLQGSREWSKLWAAIVEAADSYHLVKIKLSIDMPALHESFYANWESKRPWRHDTERVWRLTHPLMLDDELVGQLDFSGVAETAEDSPTLRQIVLVLEFLEPIEEDIRRIREQISHEQPEIGLGLPREAALAGPAARPLISPHADPSSSPAFQSQPQPRELPVGK